MDNHFVIKRDGSEEIFDKNKIRKVLIAAGLPPEQAETIANTVENWVQTNNLAKFSSLTLRDKILELLRDTNQQVADLYQWYEGTKDKH